MSVVVNPPGAGEQTSGDGGAGHRGVPSAGIGGHLLASAQYHSK